MDYRKNNKYKRNSRLTAGLLRTILFYFNLTLSFVTELLEYLTHLLFALLYCCLGKVWYFCFHLFLFFTFV